MKISSNFFPSFGPAVGVLKDILAWNSIIPMGHVLGTTPSEKITKAPNIYNGLISKLINNWDKQQPTILEAKGTFEMN